ncbi:hypothetical protein LWI28_022624 [Acer negundo]|uniref:Beta-galactosidase n=1 Tax=Acer negundo TaxID=4023 RepID=A0AAD5J5S8_ACENE|nr:hypothetical protein LWI28_022624 [Acer negundo]
MRDGKLLSNGMKMDLVPTHQLMNKCGKTREGDNDTNDSFHPSRLVLKEGSSLNFKILEGGDVASSNVGIVSRQFEGSISDPSVGLQRDHLKRDVMGKMYPVRPADIKDGGNGYDTHECRESRDNLEAMENPKITGNSSRVFDVLSGLVSISGVGLDQQKRRVSVSIAEASKKKNVASAPQSVTYDGRSLIVNETYVFWNIHEPVEGQFNFEGQYDLVKFIRLIKEHDMHVIIRLGPFIQAEWNNGGLPYWLREIPGIIFRSDNAPFKAQMQKWITKIIDMLRSSKLFAREGGPIILAQIENEYNTIQLAYKELGNSYIQWAANLAISFDVGVPWVMCKQYDVLIQWYINTCNGRHCGDTFPGPNRPYKPSLWTENWTAQFRVFGDPPSQRAAEDIAFAVSRFFSKNGTLTNYYMYHGGTNFGRTAAHFVTTRYYDEAPLDEYGLQREPKWGHLKDMHRALNLCKKPLLNGVSRVEKLGIDVEARIFEGPGMCAAFLANNASILPITVKFMGNDIYLPAKSISILPDCKTVVFNSQSEFRTITDFTQKELSWETYKEVQPTFDKLQLKSRIPLELFSLNKDTTDYAWYSTSLGHALVGFVNGKYVGTAHGNHVEKSFVFEKPIELRAGVNHITLLAMTVGFPDSGAYMEKRFAGPRSVEILGLNTGTLDITSNEWGHQAGLDGEKVRIYTQGGSHRVDWNKLKKNRPAISWYKAYFDPPKGTEPVAVRMNNMGKGMIWVNGKSIGRHWMSFLSPLGQPTQSEYHIPRSYMKPSDNFLVILEEEEGVRPEDIEIVTVNRDTICSYVQENAPPPVNNWEVKANKFRFVGDGKTVSQLKCPKKKKIVAVEFASFGNPIGSCSSFIPGNCSSSISKKVVEKRCLGRGHVKYLLIELSLMTRNLILVTIH